MPTKQKKKVPKDEPWGNDYDDFHMPENPAVEKKGRHKKGASHPHVATPAAQKVRESKKTGKIRYAAKKHVKAGK